jgi:hypothetical protein
MTKHRAAETVVETAEARLEEVLLADRAWPEHYREAYGHLAAVVGKMLDDDQADELAGAMATLAQAGEGFHLRIGFALGRIYAAFGEVAPADVRWSVEQAGGRPPAPMPPAWAIRLSGLAEGVVPQ